MGDEEQKFLEEQLAANELLPCAVCRQETLHAHVEVLERYSTATDFLMACTACGTQRSWMHLETQK
jgi:hypothetical protein